MAVKMDTLETVPPHVAIAAGLGGKAILLINGEFRAETTRGSKCDHLLHDGSVRLDFMTDDVNEAEKGANPMESGRLIGFGNSSVRALTSECQSSGPSFNTCAKAARVGRVFETCLRRQVLSFEHHKTVASIKQTDLARMAPKDIPTSRALDKTVVFSSG
jgi:hypothetical protein